MDSRHIGAACSRRHGGEGGRSRGTWAGLQAGGGACGGRAGAAREAGRALDLVPILRGLERFPGLRRRGRLAVEGLGDPSGRHDSDGLPAPDRSDPSP